MATRSPASHQLATTILAPKRLTFCVTAVSARSVRSRLIIRTGTAFAQRFSIRPLATFIFIFAPPRLDGTRSIYETRQRFPQESAGEDAAKEARLRSQACNLTQLPPQKKRVNPRNEFQ